MAPAGVVAVKSPEAFRTISEVAEMLDVPQHVLRFWETRFSQIRPIKRAGGRRFYRPEDVDLLRGIQMLLYFEGYTIRGAQKVLREKGVRYTAALGREVAKNGQAAEPAEPASVENKEHAFDVVVRLAQKRDGTAAALTKESQAAAACEVEAVESPRSDNPRRTKLIALRGELLELKSRIVAARGRA